ncbi:MAG: UDP-N-acetylglucosamine 2-epimerase [Planctomycetota bacterium]|nr:UDP-N-acetylglucosamine 2-epimerase [Planctomycetota bacterium]
MAGPVDVPFDMTRRGRVGVVTGSRAEFGLLRPVMAAVRDHPHLELLCIAAGSHLVSPALTYYEVKREFPIAAAVPMQTPGRTGRDADVQALGLGITRFGRVFADLALDWVVVLGDRIEAFAAGAAASVGGVALAHVHGGDRAEGVADEAMRHALTKLAHVHFPATSASAERLRRMGEPAAFVHEVGSPAIDDLASYPAINDETFRHLGEPDTLVLMHPIGRDDEREEAAMAEVLGACAGRRVLALHPNLDPGRGGIVRALRDLMAIDDQTPAPGDGRPVAAPHLERRVFVGLLKRLASGGGVMVGNSSAGLIEASALGLAAVDVGRRQAGRERPASVVHVDAERCDDVRAGVERALAWRAPAGGPVHPYGDGHAGERIAAALARVYPRDPDLLRKRCAY